MFCDTCFPFIYRHATGPDAPILSILCLKITLEGIEPFPRGHKTNNRPVTTAPCNVPVFQRVFSRILADATGSLVMPRKCQERTRSDRTLVSFSSPHSTNRGRDLDLAHFYRCSQTRPCRQNRHGWPLHCRKGNQAVKITGLVRKGRKEGTHEDTRS